MNDGKAQQDGHNGLAFCIETQERGRQHPGCPLSFCRPQEAKKDKLTSRTHHTACAWVQEAHAELAALEASFRVRAESSQAALAKLVEAKDTKEREMYVKVNLSPSHCTRMTIKLQHGPSCMQMLTEG